MFITKGWRRFSYDPAIAAWAQAALRQAKAVVAQPEMRKKWLQCQGTWFVGVDALASDGQGALGGVSLAGEVIDWLSEIDYLPFHPAQLSVIYPGYPKPRIGDTEAGFRYRKNRDAAHVDGLLAVGPERRRMLKEPHAFILGLPLNSCSPAASPMVVWEGSHLIIAEVFQKAFVGIDAASWAEVDVTAVYQAARRQVFERCKRVLVHAAPGEAYVVHRLALHGVASWQSGADAPEEGRMIAYFRPELETKSLWSAV
ncbi:MAG: hypothetical protein P8P89_05735 [Paracoccaceae bacterium]|nr:hypothetical protein [Paracoccaceae bacterium]